MRCLNRLGDTTQPQKNGRPGVRDAGIVLFHVFRFQQRGDCGFGLARLVAGEAKVVPRARMAWIQLHRLDQRGCGFIRLPGFVPGERQFVVVLRFVGFKSDGFLQGINRFIGAVHHAQRNGKLVPQRRGIAVQLDCPAEVALRLFELVTVEMVHGFLQRAGGHVDVVGQLAEQVLSGF